MLRYCELGKNAHCTSAQIAYSRLWAKTPSPSILYNNPHKIMSQFFTLCRIIRDFDLASILRSIALPFVFLYIIQSELIDYLSQTNFNLPEFKSPAIAISPLFLINEELQSVTVKNLRKIQKFPKSYKKQDMINALLITN